MVLLKFSAEEFLILGLKLAGHDPQRTARTCYNTNLERFVSCYFASPIVCEKIFEDLQTTTIEGAKATDPKPRKLLLALYFLKKYPGKCGLEAFNDSTEKTALLGAWEYIILSQSTSSRPSRAV